MRIFPVVEIPCLLTIRTSETLTATRAALPGAVPITLSPTTCGREIGTTRPSGMVKESSELLPSATACGTVLVCTVNWVQAVAATDTNAASVRLMVRLVGRCIWSSTVLERETVSRTCSAVTRSASPRPSACRGHTGGTALVTCPPEEYVHDKRCDCRVSVPATQLFGLQ